MLRKLFLREKLVAALKGLGILRLRVSHSSLMEVSILSLVLFLALMLRLLPLRWGFHLSEFDPYFQYRSAEYIVDNGLVAWSTWHDTMRWHPYGTYVGRGSFPGLPVTAAFFYLVAKALGLSITLFDFCVVFPAIMGTITCLVIYFLGKDIGGKEVGLFSSFFLALNTSYIGRTSLGFFDDETVGIFGIILFYLFFLRSIEKERTLKSVLIYAVAAGLSLGYICTSWGAARYPIAMTSLFVFILILLRRYSPRLLLSYSVSFGVAFFMAINVPRLGFKFLTETFNLSVPAVFLLLCLCELFRHVESVRTKTILFFSFFALSFAMVFVLGEVGFIRATPSRFLGVLNPLIRQAEPLVESVAEHKPGAWGSFYYEYGIGAFFIPVGLFFTVQNLTNRNVFLSIFTLTTVYFAGSMIRLTLLMAPAFCLLWALALVRLLRPFIAIMREVPTIPRRRRRFERHVGKEFSAAFLIMIFLLLAFTIALPREESLWPKPIRHADTPTTIASSSIPVRSNVSDWIDALAWMRDNLPENAVVASWWDYGYWITIVANKTSIIDNGTWNGTQIAEIGRMFLSNEPEAVKILDNYDATHVVVFTTFSIDQQYGIMDRGYGEEGKWRWMAKIAGLNETDYGEWDEQGRWVWNAKGSNTVLYKMMTYGREQRIGIEHSTNLEHFSLVYFSRGHPYGPAVVCVYKVLH